MFWAYYFETCSKTKHDCFVPKRLNWPVCASMNRTKEEFDDAARQPVWIQDYNIWELFDFKNCGPWGRIFWGVKQRQKIIWTFKNLCPRTCEKWTVEQCIGMYNSIFFELYVYNSPLFWPIHFDTVLCILHFSSSFTFLISKCDHFSEVPWMIFQLLCFFSARFLWGQNCRFLWPGAQAARAERCSVSKQLFAKKVFQRNHVAKILTKPDKINN